MLKAGIVGLPNVGKSTLFNAVTRSHKAAAENYPFCTIDPNLGVVTVPDPRLDALATVVKVPQRISTTIEFVDIAGLVKGASHGEGLGNKFLSHIREVDSLIHVVRCFEDPDIHHVTGSPDPVQDIEIVTTELVLADLESVRKRHERVSKDAKRGDKHALLETHCLERLEPHLNAGKPANLLAFSGDEAAIVRGFGLLTLNPVIFAANVKGRTSPNPATTRTCDGSASSPARIRRATPWWSAPNWKATWATSRRLKARSTWRGWVSRKPVAPR
jgi:hypothetical protein